MKMSVRLWGVNKWLRFTGFRINIAYDNDLDLDEREHRLELRWWGRPSKGVMDE